MPARYQRIWSTLLILGILVPVSLSGCQSGAPRPTVLAFTGTNLGVEVSQNVATQTPQMKLGYNRGEVAIVRDKNDNVLMEFGYGGGSHNIYQRLAVGPIAVTVGPAVTMFSKDVTGAVTPSAAAAVASQAKATEAQANAEKAKAEAARAKSEAEEARAKARQ